MRKRAGIYSLNPAGKGDYYDPAREQFRRQQMAIYESQKERGLSDKEAWQSSWAIATRVGQKHGWLKKGTQEPTAKGRRGAKEKLKSGDAWAKRQKYELELSRRRKSGKHRVVPQRQGKQTRYYVQPGGRYFYGKGAKKRAEALRDELNGVKMRGRKRKAANPSSSFVISAIMDDGTHKEFSRKRFQDAKKKAEQLAKRADAVVVTQDGHLIFQYRNNWLPAAAAVLTIADIGYRSVKKRRKKKKGEENPRYLDERGGMARGHYGLHSAARDQLQQARILGQLKGLRELAYQRIQGTKQKHREARVEAQRDLDKVEIEFTTLVRQVTNEIPSRESGLRSQAQSKAMGALRTEYSTAYHKVLDDQAAKRRRRRKVSNPRDLPADWAQSTTGRAAVAPKRTRGISAFGVGDPWAGVKSPKPYQGMTPTLFREDGVFYLVYEGKSRKIPRVISEANRASGLRGAKWRREKSVTSALWKDVDETPTRYAIQHPKSGRGSKSDPYRIYDKVKKKFLGKTFTLKKEADKELWRLQGGTRRDYSPQARGLEDRPRIEQVRSDRQAGEQITAYRTTSQSRAQYVARHLTFLEIMPGVFPRSPTSTRAVPKGKATKRASRKTDPFERKLAELEALEAQLAALKAKANPMRANSFAAVGRGALAGGRWLVQSKTGRTILSEAAVIGTMIVGEKLMSKGKVSPRVMKYIQARVEKETGQKPSQAEVRKVLKGIDPNQDQTLTADEVTRVLKKGRRKR